MKILTTLQKIRSNRHNGTTENIQPCRHWAKGMLRQTTAKELDMTFDLTFQTQDGNQSPLQLNTGEILFVLGSNGTGKTNLMHYIAKKNRGATRKISAHRQTWIGSDKLDMTPSTKVQMETGILNDDHDPKSRYRDDYARERMSMTIYDLVNAENVLAREIAELVKTDDIDAAKKIAKKAAPIADINELLQNSNIPITISIHENERIMASKEGSPLYSAAELSDGERNALLIAGSVLTAPPDTLLIIDEPERHLHRSIISTLLGRLFEKRADCGFVISTHDQDLPLEVREARVLLLRSCKFHGRSVPTWDADELQLDDAMDDTIKRDLLGARRKIIFVEGTNSSLDKSLYSIVFPMVSVIAKGSCQEVEQAVAGVRASESFHWLCPFGIVDGDGYTPEQVQEKRDQGIYALPFYSVEAIYFHPKIIRWISERKTEHLTGGNASNLAERALEKGVAEIRNHTERLSKNAVKKLVRRDILGHIPNDDNLLQGEPVEIANNAEEVLAKKVSELNAVVEQGNWEAILRECSIKESGAMDAIVSTLGFRTQEYKAAVRHLVESDNHALEFVRKLFDGLFDQLQNRSASSLQVGSSTAEC